MKTRLVTLFFITSTFILKAQFGEPSIINYPWENGKYELADFDNDGDLDAIGLNHSNEVNSIEGQTQLVIFENLDQVGNDWSHVRIDISGTLISIEVGDFNNDGWLDFMTSQIYPNEEFTIFENTGDDPGIFFSQSTIPFDFFLNQTEVLMKTVDWNADNNPDIIFPASGGIYGLTNLGNGNFGIDTLATLQNTMLNFFEMELVDFDVDGDQDLVLLYKLGFSGSPLKIVWFENLDGLWNLSEEILLFQNSEITFGPITLGAYFEMEIADFNDDGLPDIFYHGLDDVYLRFQSPDQTFSDPINLGILNPHTQPVANDFDNDGKIDIVFGPNIWLRNTDNNGTFVEINNGLGNDEIILNGYNRLKLEDIEGDGDLDYFLSTKNASNVDDLQGFYFFRNETSNGIPNTSAVIFISNNLHGLFETFPLDLDEDGDQDILTVSEKGNLIAWQENTDGLGNFSQPEILFSDSLIFKIIPADIDNDGDVDLVGMHLQNDFSASIFVYEKIDSLPTFSKQTIIDADYFTAGFYLVDWDMDGDLEIAVDKVFGVKIYEHQGGLTFSEINDISGTGVVIDMADINGDNLIDVFYRDSFLHIFTAIQDNSGNFTHQEISQNPYPLGRKMVDIDDDGDMDFIVAEQTQGGYHKLILLLNNAGAFEEHEIIEQLVFYNIFGNPDIKFYDVVDLDGDGKKDIFNGSKWFKQLSGPLDFSTPFPLSNPISGNTLIPSFGDFNGDNYPDIFYNYDVDGILWLSNLLANGVWLEGTIFADKDNNCDWTPPSDTTLSQWIVQIGGGGQTVYASTNSLGNYAAFLPDTGHYLVQPIIPSVYWNSCFVDTLVAVIDTANATVLDIPIQVEVECPLLGLQISMGPVRPCMMSSIAFSYCNYGTVPAENAQLEIFLDSNFVVESSSDPWTSQTDSSYIFDLGGVDFNECGQIILWVTPICGEVDLGDLMCVEAHISPDSICIPPNNLWDGSTIKANGICQNDSTTFYLENIGEGAMDESRELRVQIVNDEIIMLIFIDTFLLEADEIQTFTFANNENALRIEADQDSNHPVALIASTLVSNCSNLPANIANNLIFNFPNNDGDPFSEMVCRTVTGSYDPNFKEAFPRGTYGEFIEKEWELEYNIHFQNEGTDTAFTVIVRDTIAQELDLATLRVGASSHQMSWELTTERELIFTFNNILLPDKNTNEPLSHGYLQFFIKPMQDILPGENIDNEAAIYFDFNEPVITENVRRTIRVPTYTETNFLEFCEGDIYENLVLENDTLLVDTISISGQGLFINFNHLNVFSTTEFIDTTIAVGGFYNGILIQNDTVLMETFLDENDCEKTVTVTISVLTNLEEIFVENNLKVYPNPTSHEVFINWKSYQLQPNSIEILNSNGQYLDKIIMKNTQSNGILVNVSSWLSGVYILKLNTKLGTVYRKLIIVD